MAAPSLASAIQVGINILNTFVDKVTGTILANTGDVATQTTESDNVEMWGPLGFLSRPSNPAPGKAAAEAVVIRRGDRDVCIAARDQRSQQLAGNLNPGETVMYAGGATGASQGRVLIKADGSVTLFTTDSNTATGNPVALRISPTGGLEFTSQWGSMVFDQTGFHVRTQAGPRLDMGGISLPGVPAAVTGAFAGYAKLTAPTVAIEGANVVLGMGPILGQAVWLNSNLAIGGGPVPLGSVDLALSAVMGSNTVWISQ